MPIDSTYVESGTSLGSNEDAFLKAPRVLLAWDTPTVVALRRLDALRARAPLRPAGDGRAHRSLGRANLADFDVVVLPSGNYAGAINDAVLNRLKDWLRAGGTLVTLAEATRWATGSSVGLLDTHAAAQGRPARRAGRCGRCGGWRSGAVGWVGCGRWRCGCERSGAKPPSTPASTTTRRFSPIASGRPRSPARSCASRSTPTTG